MKSSCDTDKLVEFVDGELPVDEASKIEAHLSECPSCRKAADDFKLSLDAALAVMDAEGQMVSRNSMAPAVMSRIGQQGAGGLRWWPQAIAAVIAAIMLTAGFFHFQKHDPVEMAQPMPVAQKIESTTSLIVHVSANQLDVNDRVGERLRTVNVKP